ncbi:MAG TPA: M20/M25/M40 family metallo-hydrolase [Candidatus Dormibacteraeota bacterium]|nr:M20/M25/M40 family metallo-hydrolase [Candidatus Dormibacteraeota bacterium]
MLEEAIRRARQEREAAEADLFEELRIPSVSALPEHRGDVRRNADWLAARFDRLGMTTRVVDVPGGRHPVVQADLERSADAPWLTLYGHYDVQPADPVGLWSSPPFEPTVRDGHVYARGSADNKGCHMAALKAFEYALAAGGPPVNVRFLVEGEEEITGQALGTYVRENAERLRTDHVLVWDGGFTEEGEPTLVTGLRGILYVELEATGPSIDLHSGVFGGVAPNPLNTLARVLAELKGRDGRVTIPGFYDDVRSPSEAELRAWERPAGYAELLQRMTGARALEGEAEYSLTERQWSRPTLDVHGFSGGFTGDGVKTVIPALARAKVSMRLVPDQDPDRVSDRLLPYLEDLTTPGVAIEVRRLGATRPVLCGADHAGARAASAAFAAAFGAPARLVRQGGSVPVAIDFQEALGAQMVISGLAEADCAAHSPDEKLSLDHYHRGIEMLLHYLYGLA